MSAARVDVLVVGGGPAGSSAARLLALGGWRVALLDRASFPRPKPCGECLNPGAVHALERLGVLDAVRALDPAPLAGWRVRSGSHVALGRFPGGRLALSVDRTRFDRALLDQARAAGVTVHERTKLVGIDPTPDRGSYRVATARGPGGPERWLARVIVGADGLRSTVARSVSAYRRRPRLRKVSVTLHVDGVVGADALGRDEAGGALGHLLLDRRGTVGLAPLDPRGSVWNATVVVDADEEGPALGGDPGGFALTRLAAALGPGWRGGRVDGPWTSGPFDWPSRTAVADGVALVGDAAGYYDPLTGQGIYRALRSAELAAAAIAAALARGPVTRAELAPYAASLRRELRVPLGVQHGVEAVISSELLRPAALGLLGRARRAMDTLIGVTGDMVPTRELLRPSIWSGLLT